MERLYAFRTSHGANPGLCCRRYPLVTGKIVGFGVVMPRKSLRSRLGTVQYIQYSTRTVQYCNSTTSCQFAFAGLRAHSNATKPERACVHACRFCIVGRPDLGEGTRNSRPMFWYLRGQRRSRLEHVLIMSNIEPTPMPAVLDTWAVDT